MMLRRAASITSLAARRAAQRVRQGERIDLHAGLENSRRGRVGIGVAAAQHLGAGEMGHQADVSDGRRLAVAGIGRYARRARAYPRWRGCRRPANVRAITSASVVDMKLVLEILAHPRHDERMGIHRHDLGERAPPRVDAQSFEKTLNDKYEDTYLVVAADLARQRRQSC